MGFRNPSIDEIRLLSMLIAKAPELNLPVDWKDTIQVSLLDDSGMGSLCLLLTGSEEKNNRRFGTMVNECQFTDVDGIQVIASVNLDQYGQLFELDIWKTDFSPLICIPEQIECH